MTNERISQYDPSNMRSIILSFPKQVEEAVAIGERAKISMNLSSLQNIVINGMGGSAIGGDLLRAYLGNECRVPIVVNRHYALPAFVNKKSLIVISSYSGNTEETTAAYREALRRRAKIICITSGGEVSKIAGRHRHPAILIPGGLPPRGALGYSFFPMLIAFSKLGLAGLKKKEINETVSLLRMLSARYAGLESEENRALRIAESLHGKLPVIYSSVDRFDAINVRWRGQMSENAKVLAYGHVFPELNHNEIVGWEVLGDVMKYIHVVILRDKNDHRRVRFRMDVTKNLIGDYAGAITEVYSEGTSLLARMFSLIYLADWVSFYLAILNGVDPMPVKKIDLLKNELATMK